MNRISEHLRPEKEQKVLNHYNKKLIKSGSNRKERVKIIKESYSKFKQKISAKEIKNEPRYRSAEETVVARTEKKLIEKITWYKKTNKFEKRTQNGRKVGRKGKAPKLGKNNTKIKILCQSSS